MSARKVRQALVAAMSAVLVAGAAGCTQTAKPASSAVSRSSPATSGQPPPCAVQALPPTPVAPTTLTVIEQAYYCVFAHYFTGPALDDRVLLAGAFAGFTQELDRLGLDQADAAMPALTGDRGRDWDAFAAVYRKVTGQLPARPAQRQALAAATLTGMIASLDDNHAQWIYQPQPPGYVPGDSYGLGITTSPADEVAVTAPHEAQPPLFVAAVTPGSPAAGRGVRPGDVIVSVDGAPPFAGGVVSEGVMSLLFAPYPQAGQVSVRLQRPATGRTWTLTLTPALYLAPTPLVSAKLLDGDIAYVRLPAFFPGAADQVLRAIANLAPGARLHGLILDLRGNRGGAPSEVGTLLGAFIHGAAWSYDCDSHNRCTANDTDGSTPLLHLPLVVLTDRSCVSACDAFSGAVKDHRLGILVGTRTAGIASGPATGYLLGDGSVLALPARHELGADHELINGVGVAPDYFVPLTAYDLSTGRDPDIAKALALLAG
jgi:carboxyl-terminal processing protease